MKKFITILLPALLIALVACKKDNEQPPKFEIVIDAEHCTSEGSYVQGTPLNQYCKAILPYSESKGGETVVVHSDTVNGMVVAPQTVMLPGNEGNISVAITGLPIDLVSTWLPVVVALNGKSYYAGVEVTVVSDLDTSGVVTFALDTADMANLNTTTTLDFTVDPPMTGVVVSGAPNGLAVSVSQNKSAGTGSITFNPTSAFLNGTVTIVATFGARPIQTRNVKVNAFANGSGTSASPYEVSTAAQLAKMAYARTGYFKLMDNITASSWNPISGAFNGQLDGNSKSLNLTINTTGSDSVALFKSLGATSTVKNITLTGSVTGRNYVAALAANKASGSTITGVTASGVAVTGANYVAQLAAAGTGADASILSFTNVPSLINIVQGSPSATAALGVTPKASTVAINAGNTGMTGMYAPDYDPVTGNITVYMPASGFREGDITFTAQLPSATNVTSAPRTIKITSDKLNEGGSGTEGDPYRVITASQLAMTMNAYPASYIRLDEDNISLSTWATHDAPAFTGNLDGNGYKCTGLAVPFMNVNTGTITNIKFVNVAIATNASGNLGAVARTNKGKITSIAVSGTLNTAADCLGAIAGENNDGGVILNCYANVTLTSNMSAVGGIVGRINNSTGGKTNVIKNCTAEGTITVTGNKAQIGGILGRKTGTNGNTTNPDSIIGCLSSMKITASSSNMVAGIFGAIQPSDRSLIVAQCLFSGTVSASFSVGGIGGITHEITDCMVQGAGAVSAVSANTISSSATGGTEATASGAGIVAGAKGGVTRCIVADAKIAGNTANSKVLGGIISTQNANAPEVNSCIIISSMLATSTGRGIAGGTANLTLSNNYRSGLQASDGTAYAPSDNGADKQDGAAAPELTLSWFESLGYDFSKVWEWDTAFGRPKLRKVGCDESVKPAN